MSAKPHTCVKTRVVAGPERILPRGFFASRPTILLSMRVSAPSSMLAHQKGMLIFGSANNPFGISRLQEKRSIEMQTEEYFRSISTELDSLKNRVRHLIRDQNWQTDGEWKESVLRTIIQRSAPRNMTVGRGFIVDRDRSSTQIDILIYDNSYPVLYKDGDLVFISPSACRAVIEVKTSVTRPSFQRAVEKLGDVAELARGKKPTARLAFSLKHRPKQKRRKLLASDASGVCENTCHVLGTGVRLHSAPLSSWAAWRDASSIVSAGQLQPERNLFGSGDARSWLARRATRKREASAATSRRPCQRGTHPASSA